MAAKLEQSAARSLHETGRNLGTFKTRAAAEQRERAVQFFKHRG
jgi:hypothetical protein